MWLHLCYVLWLMSTMMGSLTFAYKLCTEVGQATAGQVAKPSLFPVRVSRSLTPRPGQEAWVHQEEGGTPEGPAELKLPETEECGTESRPEREGCLQGRAQGPSWLLSVHLHREIPPPCCLVVACEMGFRREGLLREGMPENRFMKGCGRALGTALGLPCCPVLSD